MFSLLILSSFFLSHRDAIIISILDSFTSVLAGCLAFASIGSMAYQQGKAIEDVVKTQGNINCWSTKKVFKEKKIHDERIHIHAERTETIALL